MKNNEKKLIIILPILIMIIILLGTQILLLKDGNITNSKQIIKEMTQTEYESQLDKLNKSHEDYTTLVQENKRKLATAISDQKVTTSEDASIDEMVTNIGKILQAGTEDATATAEDIKEGKTAYVNGSLITGNSPDTTNNYSSVFYYYQIGGTGGSFSTLTPSFYNPNLFTISNNTLTALEDMNITTYYTGYERNGGVTVQFYKNSNLLDSFSYEYWAQGLSKTFSLSKGDTFYLNFKNTTNNVTCFSIAGIVT